MKRLLCVIPSLMLVAACGGEDRIQTTGQQTAAVRTEDHTQAGQCAVHQGLVRKVCARESVAKLAVDADYIQSLLPPGLTALRDPNTGLGEVQIVAQHDCTRGDAAGDFMFVWLAVEGPYVVDPVPGTSFTGPTHYWYVPEARATDPIARRESRLTGMTYLTFKGADLSPLAIPGQVSANSVNVNGSVAYSWSGTITKYFPGIPIGVNHVLYTHNDCTSDLWIKKIKIKIRLYSNNSPGATITASPNSYWGKHFGTSNTGTVTTLQLVYADVTSGLTSL
jgi:hypothetical protein